MSRPKVVGLMVARDEEVTVGLTIESINGLVDELIFVDHACKDRTAEIVRTKCQEFGIGLHEYHGEKNVLLGELRRMALRHGRALKPKWFFMVDADMVYTNVDNLRKLTKKRKYDQYWFRMLNISGDKDHFFCQLLTEPHLYLFRNKPGIDAPMNYICSEDTHRMDPSTDGFIGWNLSGFRYYDHLFWSYQMTFSRKYNEVHGVEWSVEEYIENFFGDNLTEEYKKEFVLNRLRHICTTTFEEYAEREGIPFEEFSEKYLGFPDAMKEWGCPFELMFDDEGGVIGRSPDLVDVPLLDDVELDHYGQLDSSMREQPRKRGVKNPLVVGLMMARDEALTVGMTIDSIKGLVDEMVFVNNSSTDGTAEIVRRKCEENKIVLHEYEASLEHTWRDIRGMTLNYGMELDPDWFFTCDADMVFRNAKYLRRMIKKAEYDQYWFETMNLTGGKYDLSFGSINEPHLWLFRNKNMIFAFGNYVCQEETHTKDPNDRRFLGWNLNGIKYYDRMFWRYQVWFSRKFNEEFGTDISVTEYVKKYFGDNGPGEGYMKKFVLNRLRRMCKFDLDSYAKFRGIPQSAFEKKYMKFPKMLREWDCPFELIYDENGEVIGRKPDLIDVPILEDAEIDQLASIDREKNPLPTDRRGVP